jgi:hypothetical protein
MAATKRQMRALKLRLTPMGYKDIGEQMGVGQQRAQDLTHRAVRWLRNEPDHPDHWMVAAWREIVHVRNLG